MSALGGKLPLGIRGGSLQLGFGQQCRCVLSKMQRGVAPADKGGEHLKFPRLVAEIVRCLRNPFVLHKKSMI
jgi:hypothetical protein